MAFADTTFVYVCGGYSPAETVPFTARESDRVEPGVWRYNPRNEEWTLLPVYFWCEKIGEVDRKTRWKPQTGALQRRRGQITFRRVFRIGDEIILYWERSLD